jgi:hypothetical protein
MSCANAASAASVVRVAGRRRGRWRCERFAPALRFLNFDRDDNSRDMTAPRRRIQHATSMVLPKTLREA